MPSSVFCGNEIAGDYPESLTSWFHPFDQLFIMDHLPVDLPGIFIEEL
jgi:hypothetical protein